MIFLLIHLPALFYYFYYYYNHHSFQVKKYLFFKSYNLVKDLLIFTMERIFYPLLKYLNYVPLAPVGVDVIGSIFKSLSLCNILILDRAINQEMHLYK